ncbi:MAG: hypothetical protein EP338_03420, partial [Bacteroidetes bacterium]
MKRNILLTVLLILSGFSYTQQSWEIIDPPAGGATEFEYFVDDNGSVYALYTDFDGGGNRFYISQYLNSNNTWLVIYSDPIADVGMKMKTDHRAGTAYVSFISDQAQKTMNVYSMSAGTVTKEFSSNIVSCDAYKDYDFKVGNDAGEYFWYMVNDPVGEAMLVSYNGGAFTSTLVDDLTGLVPNKLLMQTVGDTIWLAFAVVEGDLQLFKTHDVTINFLPAESGDINGYVSNGASGRFLYSDLFFLSDRSRRLLVGSFDGNGGPIEKLYTDGSASFASTFLEDFATTTTGSTDGADKIYALASVYRNGYESTKVLVKDLAADLWDTLGPTSEEIFTTSPSVSNQTSMFNTNTNRFVGGYYSDSQFKLAVLNTPADATTLTATQDVLCTGSATPASLYTEFSLEDENFDTLRIIDVTSSNVTVLANADISYSTVSKTGKRQYLDIKAKNASAGSTTLTIKIYDGYDTTTVNQSLTFSSYEISSVTTDYTCGSGTTTLGASISSGTIKWYDVSSGGTVLGSGTSFTSPVITADKIYYAEGVSTGGCLTTRVPVTGYVYTVPSVATTTPASNCGVGTITLGATPSAGASIYWYDAASAGSLIGTGNSYTSPTINTTTTYYAEADDGYCASSTVAVVATINTVPGITSTTPATICGTGTATLGAAASAGTISWFDASSGGTNLGSGTTFTTPSISTTTSYWVETSDGTCTSPRSEVIATVNTAPTITATTPGSNCGTGTVTLGATASSGT